MQTELADRAVRMVTFTHVRVSDDLHYATAYYSVLGDDTDRQAIVDYFAQERKRIQHLLGRNLHLRRIPELTLKYDPSVEEGIRIERLLNEIKSNQQQ